MKHPCVKECPERAVGCAIRCPKWAEYVIERDKIYALKDELSKLKDYQSVKRSLRYHERYRLKRR